MERFEGVFIGALVCFAIAFVLSGVLPVMALNKVNNKYLTFEDLSQNVSDEFVELGRDYPEEFMKAYGAFIDKDQRSAVEVALKQLKNDWTKVDEKDLRKRLRKAYAESLQVGRDTYISESCWHCHSQYIRPVAKEEQRWGPVSQPQEYNNALSMPPLWGTRRVGPDLSRQRGVHTNDWHLAHLYEPTATSPNSVMPRYPWFFEGDVEKPGKRALSIVTYLQWLGTTFDQVPEALKKPSKNVEQKAEESK